MNEELQALTARVEQLERQVEVLGISRDTVIEITQSLLRTVQRQNEFNDLLLADLRALEKRVGE